MGSIHQPRDNMARLIEVWETLQVRHRTAPWKRLVSHLGGDWDTLPGKHSWSGEGLAGHSGAGLVYKI